MILLMRFTSLDGQSCADFIPKSQLQSLKYSLVRKRLFKKYIYKFIYFNWRLITLQYCIRFAIHIRHGCTRVPHPELPSHLPPHTIPLGHPSAPAPRTEFKGR